MKVEFDDVFEESGVWIKGNEGGHGLYGCLSLGKLDHGHPALHCLAGLLELLQPGCWKLLSRQVNFEIHQYKTDD